MVWDRINSRLVFLFALNPICKQKTCKKLLYFSKCCLDLVDAAFFSLYFFKNFVLRFTVVYFMQWTNYCRFSVNVIRLEKPKLESKLEPKQTEEQPKKLDREHIFVFFQKILGCFGLFRNSFFRLFRFYTKTAKQRISLF